MIGLEIDVGNLRERGTLVEISYGMKLDFVYNNMDDFIYVAVIDDKEKKIVGHTKLVPNIDLLALTRNDSEYQLRCIKINDYAEERDKITPENLNHDYKFFLI